MEYQVIKVYNNNVILAKDGNRQVVLVSKGIGFGKKPGDCLEQNAGIEKVFHELSPSITNPNLIKIDEINDSLDDALAQFMRIVQDKLGIMPSICETTISEHIKFAIERLKMGIAIENPFIDEIRGLYKTEYKLAGIARELIKKRFDFEIGEEEQGFIAMHLYAARTNHSINDTLRITRIFKRCGELIEDTAHITLDLQTPVWKQFCNTMKLMLRLTIKKEDIAFPIKDIVRYQLPLASQCMQKIARYIEEEKKVVLSDDAIGYITVEVEKLIQYTMNYATQRSEKTARKNIDVSMVPILAKQYTDYFGGVENIKTIDSCMTRLRVQVIEAASVETERLKSLGCIGVQQPAETCYYVILGPVAEPIAEEMKWICGKEKK